MHKIQTSLDQGQVTLGYYDLICDFVDMFENWLKIPEIYRCDTIIRWCTERLSLNILQTLLLYNCTFEYCHILLCFHLKKCVSFVKRFFPVRSFHWAYRYILLPCFTGSCFIEKCIVLAQIINIVVLCNKLLSPIYCTTTTLHWVLSGFTVLYHILNNVFTYV